MTHIIEIIHAVLFRTIYLLRKCAKIIHRTKRSKLLFFFGISIISLSMFEAIILSQGIFIALNSLRGYTLVLQLSLGLLICFSSLRIDENNKRYFNIKLNIFNLDYIINKIYSVMDEELLAFAIDHKSKWKKLGLSRKHIKIREILFLIPLCWASFIVWMSHMKILPQIKIK
jgi:hypothetical protein